MAALISLVVVSAASAWTPTRDNLIDRRHNVNDIRKDKCRDVIPTHFLPFNISAYWLERKYQTWGRFKDRAREASSKCSVASIIRSVFGAYGDQAVAVASCESGLYVFAQNGQYLGLFQMGEYARSRYGHSWTALGQSRSAYAYFRDSGSDWSPWQCRPWGLGW